MIKYDDNLIMRVPKLSISDQLYEDVILKMREAKTDEEQRLVLKEIMDNTLLNEVLHLTSRTLVKCIENIEYCDNKELRSIFNTVFKYIQRMTWRATPFGALSAVSNVKLKDNSGGLFKRIKRNIYHIDLSLKFFWSLNNIVNNKIEEFPLLKIRINRNLIFSKKFIKQVIIGRNEKLESGQIYYYQRNEILDFISLYFVENETSTVIDLVEKIHQKMDIDEEKIIQLIKELLHDSYLISELYPDSINQRSYQNCYNWVINTQSDSDFLVSLKQILKSYDNLRKNFNLKQYLELQEFVKQILNVQNSLIINMESEFDSGEIMLKDFENVCELLQALQGFDKLYTSDYFIMENYKEDFIDKVGFDTMVNIVDLQIKSRIIGLPYEDKYSKLSLDQINKISKVRKIINTIFNKYDKELEISLSKEDLSKIEGTLKTEKNNIYGFDVNFQYFTKNNSGVYVFNSAPISFGYGGFSGRFQFTPKKIKKGVESRNIRFLPSNEILWEVIEKKGSSYLIDVKDIYISIDRNREFHTLDNNGNEIFIDIDSVANINLMDEAIRFIYSIRSNAININRTIDLFNMPFNGHQKRVKYKNIVLIPETWYLNTSFFKGEKCQGLRSYIELMKIPNNIVVVNGDQKLHLDLSFDLDFNVLLSIVKKESVVQIEEEFGIANEEVCDANGNPLITEFSTSFFNESFRLKTYKPLKASVSKHCTLFDGNNGWLYFRLKLDKTFVNLLIKQLHEFSTSFGVDFFFVRYEVDCRFELRIRFDMNSSDISSIIMFLYQLYSDELIFEYNIEPYYREIERYGGEQNIVLAEELFVKDSKLYWMLINDQDKSNIDAVQIKIVTEIVKKISNLADWKKLFYYPDLMSNKAIRIEFNEIKSRYKEIVLENSINEMIDNVACRLEFFIKKLQRIYGETEVFSIVDSLFHMHFNRFLNKFTDESRIRSHVYRMLKVEERL